MGEFMVYFAKRDCRIVAFAHAETIYVMKDLKWRIAIRIRTFSICLGDNLAFFMGGDITGSVTGDTFLNILRIRLLSGYQNFFPPNLSVLQCSRVRKTEGLFSNNPTT